MIPKAGVSIDELADTAITDDVYKYGYSSNTSFIIPNGHVLIPSDEEIESFKDKFIEQNNIIEEVTHL